MKNLNLADLIQRLRQGTATPEEKEILTQYWIDALEDQSFLESLSEEEKTALGALMYQNIHQKIHEQEYEQPVISLHPRRFYWAVASVVLLVLSAGIFWYMNRSPFQTEQTAFGKRREVRLPDQSVVILNGNSSIRYASEWKADQPREVWVEGEAYFAVTHTKNHQKFMVHTPDHLTIEVLGTKFNVNNRRGTTHVVLQEGKVKVSGQENTYIMKPGEMISYSAQELKVKPQKVNPKLVASWKDDLLLFQEESLASIANRLQDTYGIEVQFEDSTVAQEVFSGSVPADSVDILFEKFEKLYQIKVTKQNNRYVIQ
jgi:ferric-dicitrate binding protein FerR (iron transport regulator)